MKNLITVVSLLVASSISAAQLDGKKLFRENCAVCHGEMAQGGAGAVKGPKLIGDASNWTTKLFLRAVLEGVDDNGQALQAPMPKWKNSSFKSDNGKAPTPKEIEAIHRYLRSLDNNKKKNN